MAKAKIGFIGVGLMGAGMARNLLENGHPLTVMAHRNRAPVEDLLARGATEAATPAAMAAEVDIIHICVSGSPQVEAIVRGPDGILAAGKAGLIVIDCSTSDPVSTQQIAADLEAAGMRFADAPLAKTPKEAMEGTLDTMVGADPDLFDEIRPVLDCWAGNIVHLGPVGLGHKMKLINNFIAMGYGALYAEALAVARKSGLTVQQVDAVIRPGRLSNGFYETFMKWTLERDENAHRFAISNAAKDMAYLANTVTASGAVAPIQGAVRNAYAGMEAEGDGAKYVPMLADFIAARNGMPPAETE